MQFEQNLNEYLKSNQKDLSMFTTEVKSYLRVFILSIYLFLLNMLCSLY